jgi:hypothetical protein
MRRYNIVSRILLILTVITFVLAAPALVQDKRRAYVDMVHVPEDVITVLGKRMDEDFEMWANYAMGFYDNVWGHLNPAGIHLEPAPPPDVPPPNPAEVHEPPQNPADSDSDRELMELDDDGPPASSESGDSHSEWSTESEDFHTAPSSLGSSTDSDSDSDSDHWSAISNAPSADSESQPENLKGADTEMRGKAEVSRRISGTAGGVDSVNAAQMELRSAVDPGP